MNKIVEALRGKYLTTRGCLTLLNGDCIEVYLPGLEQIAAILQAPESAPQPEKAPEPAGFQIRNSYSKNEWTGCHGFATTEEAEQCGSEWRYVYTAPPELAEIERQLAKSETLNLAINSQLMAAIDEKAQFVSLLAEAQKDQARLDFMLESDSFVVWELFDKTFKRCYLMTQDEDEEYHRISGEGKSFDTPRQAIDEAVAQQKAKS